VVAEVERRLVEVVVQVDSGLVLIYQLQREQTTQSPLVAAVLEQQQEHLVEQAVLIQYSQQLLLPVAVAVVAVEILEQQ
jgi:hypothetical protein